MHPSATERSYQELPYIFQADTRTYPGKNAALGLMFGMQPASLDNCRILEIGCAQGANLLPIAENFPNSELVGIDISSNQIEEGQAIVKALNLTNIQLIHGDFQTLDQPPSSFDYIIVHGVFSWITQELQLKLMERCKYWLAPQGIACISFNVMPGWSLRYALRGYLQMATSHIESTSKSAQAAWDLLHSIQSNPDLGHLRWHKLLESDIQTILKHPPGYIGHEFLEDNNHPYFYKQFEALSQQHGLQILGESNLRRGILNQIDPKLYEHMFSVGQNESDWNQHYDFLNMRTFRCSLLCHHTVELSPAIQPSQLQKLYFSSPLQLSSDTLDLNPEVPITCTGHPNWQIHKPLHKAILWAFQQVYPQTLSLEDLLGVVISLLTDNGCTFEPQDILEVSQFLTMCYYRNYMHFWTHPVSAVASKTLSNRIQISRLNQHLLNNTDYSPINQQHEVIKLSPSHIQLLRHCNGTWTLKDLQKQLKVSHTELEKHLSLLAQHALFVP